ncbi:haptoglobin [Aulostomus maculatus]
MVRLANPVPVLQPSHSSAGDLQFSSGSSLYDIRDTGLRSKRLVGPLAPHVPWQVMIYLSDNVMDGGYAGGALISDSWVLTAGRNLFIRKSRQDTRGKNPIIPKVYMGIVGRPEANSTTEVAVEKVVLHPHFQNESDWDNDLALIQLKKPVVLSSKVSPIPLPERGQDLVETGIGLGIVAGWGWGSLLTLAESLKYLKLPLANHTTCKTQYKSNLFTPTVDDKMFCTEQTHYEENVCFGDAGGALAVIDDHADVYAAGILSYDKACRTERFAVYMKLSSYVPWINSVMRGDTEKSIAVRKAAMLNLQTRKP